MQGISDILKIVDGALRQDRQKAATYAEALAAKAERQGDIKAAERLRNAIAQGTKRAGLGYRKPADAKSACALFDEEQFNDGQVVEVFLNPREEFLVDEFIEHIEKADLLVEHGVSVSPKLIAYGPPGLGKTQLCRHIASRLRLPLLTARADSLVSSYLGSSSKNIRSLFEHANSRPCVLFIDEFDAIGKARDDRHELGEIKRITISLLQNIDVLDDQTVLLAATNHEHLLDPAVWRRFNYHIPFQLPSREALQKMIQIFFRGFITDEASQELAATVGELSGADIRRAADDVIRSALISGKRSVTADYAKRRIEIRSENRRIIDERYEANRR